MRALVTGTSACAVKATTDRQLRHIRLAEFVLRSRIVYDVSIAFKSSGFFVAIESNDHKNALLRNFSLGGGESR